MTQFYELTAERPSLGAQSQLIGDDAKLARAGLILLAVMTAWRLYMALITNVIWDEAHFVISGQHFDLAYPDIPAGYPWLARAVTSVFGWQVLPLRIIAIVIATAIPFAVYFMARPVLDRRNATWAAILSLLCPAMACNGPIFYPEGGLQLMLALMAGCMLRAMNGDKLKWWVATGVFAAIGLLVHYRFVVPGLAIGLFLVATPLGRKQWTRPGLYIAGGIALIGLLPAIIYNMANDWPAVQFHIVNRPKLEFNLVYVISFVMTQVMMANPVLFVGLAVGTKVAVWDQRDKPAALLGYLGAGIFAFYCLQSLVNKKIMPHWPWLSFVPLLPFAPAVLSAFVDRTAGGGARAFRMLVVGLLPVMTLGFGGVFSFMQYVNAHEGQMPYSLKGLDTSKHENWALIEPDLAEATARAHARFGNDIALATNGHASAVHIEFPAVKGRKVYTLDDPDDIKTRFVQARRQWGLDRAALMKDYAGKGVVLVLNEPEFVYHEGDEAGFYKEICGLFEDIEPVRVTTLPPGRVMLDIYTARVRTAPAAVTGPCSLLPALYVAHPLRGEFLTTKDDGHYFGMAADPMGIVKVDVLIDGQVAAATRYGLDPEGARAPDVLAYDPNYPKVQFDFDFPAGSLKPGEHKLTIRATRTDETTVDSYPRDLYVK